MWLAFDSTLTVEVVLSPHEMSLLFLPAHWKFKDKIGSGSFGSVWLGTFKPNNHSYAVKKVRITENDNSINDEIKMEVKLMSSLKHLNIVKYYGAGASGTFFWIIMEWMECGTLEDMMRMCGGRLEEGPAATVMRDVCNGLHYLHKEGVLHKDLKAGNVLVSKTAVAKLADFGVSQRSHQAADSLATHHGGGTLCFMAPEVIRGAVCAKSDVWALGMMLIQVLEGEAPFQHLSELQVAEKILDESAVPALAERYSEELRELVNACLKHSLQERISLADVLRNKFVAYAPYRDKSLLPLVEKCLAIKEEEAREAENARRRALVGGPRRNTNNN